MATVLIACVDCLDSCSCACAKNHDALAMGDVFSCQALVTAAQAKPQIKVTAMLSVITISPGSIGSSPGAVVIHEALPLQCVAREWG